MRAGTLLGFLLVAPSARPCASQGASGVLESILRVEDHRAASAAELSLLLGALSSPDTLLLRSAVRALGRLERPALAERLFPLLQHRDAGVRAEAAQAVAQAAQGFRADSLGKRRSRPWQLILEALGARVALERNTVVRGMLALSLGRLPYATSAEIARAGAQLLALAAGSEGEALVPMARAIETLLRRSSRVTPSEELLERVRSWARDGDQAPRVRRSALGGLLAIQAADRGTLSAALRADDQALRRLAVLGAVQLGEADRAPLLAAALGDSAAMVRYEALRLQARSSAPGSCLVLREATRDPVPALQLLALDLLGTACRGDSLAAELLEAAFRQGTEGWHRPAHALVSLASVAPGRARPLISAAAAAPVWQTRMYAARAAGVVADTSGLRRLAADSVANVREAALGALHELLGSGADSLYRAALGASDYQLILTAAKALAGSPRRGAGATALLAALDRITRDRKETSRDPRLAILLRLRELGRPALAARLRPYLRDFDPVVADSAAALLHAWTGNVARSRPRPLRPPPISLGEIAQLRDRRLRFTMASGGEFEVALLVDAAPLTVLRVARLVKAGYYDGLDFHRVVPNFVIQGGSPGANEYAGAARFLRDELGALSHERGTLGISTRGRDTGDAQLFINLCDNPRLDYDYTVWGRVVSGMDVVAGILEGGVIRRVEIRPR